VNSRTGAVPERLRAAMEAAAIPAGAVGAWQGPPPEPEAGQLWRARWENVAQLVLVLDVVGDRVEVAPVSLDVDYADEHSVVLPEDATPLAVEAVVWLGLRRSLSMGVLDRSLGLLAERWRDLRSSAGMNELRRGSRAGAADPRAEYRARLEDAFDVLAAATWVPIGSGALASMIRSAGLGAQELVGLLDTSPQQALAVLRGRAAVTADQARQLSAEIGLAPEEVLAANPSLPTDLVARLDRPRRRAQVRELARRRRLSETEAWRAAAYGIWALAARQTGARADPAWDDRLDRYFAVVLNA